MPPMLDDRLQVLYPHWNAMIPGDDPERFRQVKLPVVRIGFRDPLGLAVFVARVQREPVASVVVSEAMLQLIAECAMTVAALFNVHALVFSFGVNLAAAMAREGPRSEEIDYPWLELFIAGC